MTPPTNVYSPPLSTNFHVLTQKDFIFRFLAAAIAVASFYFNFVVFVQVMLILILINVPCLENVVDVEKGSNSQNHSLFDSHNPIKISFIPKFPIALILNGENKIVKASF